MGDINYHEELVRLMEQYPDLIFDNDGYENISEVTKEANAEGIKKIEELLKEAVHGFVRFQNFKPRKEGSFCVRCQTKWSESFTGVSYFPLENFKPGHPSWKEKN